MAELIIGLVLGFVLGTLMMFVLIFDEPTSKELTKEEWKAGFRQDDFYRRLP